MKISNAQPSLLVSKSFSAFMNITKVGRRGQISIPRNIRQTLNLQEGDRLAFIQRGNEVVLQPLHQT